MPDRPPVKFAGQLPEGTLNGLGVILPAVLDDEEMPVYFVGSARLKDRVHKVETGVDWAVLRVMNIEVLPDGKMGEGSNWHVAELLAELRSNRIGDNPIDFDGASDAEWAQLSELRQWVADYAAREGLSDAALGEKVLATVPGAGAGWRDSAQIMREFKLTVEESTSDGAS